LLLSVQDIVTKIDEGEGPVNAADLVVRINNRLVDRTSDVLDNLNKAFEQHGIVIAFPQQDIHIRDYVNLSNPSS